MAMSCHDQRGEKILVVLVMEFAQFKRVAAQRDLELTRCRRRRDVVVLGLRLQSLDR